ncbi:right-handed parallel beta-helix repeat-containing protein [Aeoliella sp. ICT_H6.2]|uniref:Right-handed parallel beta-helix repeat-containing protein n=1 Tax=Aeoliella straminimaris TaxID=2954799 RepID=A0A9X2JIK6_9BACT|nr:right-handed parallel beta-helix repeat-containing protein [Aeoliella straminimaris]MCO6046662.1 right-handed parallel beta-helix repeat-containing protein [Aeoliella straminimaris]
MLILMLKQQLPSALTAVFLLISGGQAFGGDIIVRNTGDLRHELRRAQPGTTITLAPGEYDGISLEGINGTQEHPIVITGADPADPPLFKGGKQAIHLSNCNYVTLRHIRVSGCTTNGINSDDGGNFSIPSKGMSFENLVIENIGPKGNHDGLKLSGLDEFAVSNCHFSGWGGSAIDMVGCHDGLIEKCHFIGKEGYSQNTGVQAKGGTENILVRQNYFDNAGGRAINIGGSTGLEFFRPKLTDYEAREIDVAGNLFVGSDSPIAYVTSINCKVRQNTIIHPGKWVVRILQEQSTDNFQPCQQGTFQNNLVVFDSRVRTSVNVGPNTKPETFVFRRNAWFCSDGNRRPSLPSKEMDGVYQVDPLLENAETPELKIGSTNPKLRGIGAHAFRPEHSEPRPSDGNREQGTNADVDKPRR